MHPGPVNRGRRAGRGGDRLATGADRRPGGARPGGADGDPLRAALGRRRGTGRRGARSWRRWSSRRELAFAGPSPARPRLSSARAAGRPSCCCAPRTCSTRAPASTAATTCCVREGEVAEIASPGAIEPRRDRGDRGRGAARLSRLRRPPRAPAHSGARGRGGPRLRNPCRRGGRLLPACSRCRTPIRSSTTRRCCARCTSAPRSRRACRSVSWPAITRGQSGRRADRDGGACGRGRGRLQRRRRADRQRRGAAQALQYQRLCGGVLALHEEDPSLSGAGSDARGRGFDAARPGGDPVDLREHDGRARRRDRRLRGRPLPHAAPLGRRVGARCRARQAPGRRRHRGGHATPPDADRRGGALARPALQDEPAAARRARPPGADRGPALGRDRLHRDRPRAARARGEGGAVRAGADGRHRPRDGVLRSLHGAGRARA